jgi:hypothetical protein
VPSESIKYIHNPCSVNGDYVYLLYGYTVWCAQNLCYQLQLELPTNTAPASRALRLGIVHDPKAAADHLCGEVDGRTF